VNQPYWCEEIAGFGAFALISPEASEAGGGADFKGLCILSLRSADSAAIAPLRRFVIASRIHQIALQPIYLGLVVPLVGCLDDLSSLGQSAQPLEWMPSSTLLSTAPVAATSAPEAAAERRQGDRQSRIPDAELNFDGGVGLSLAP
jgi:hypothetical protein